MADSYLYDISGIDLNQVIHSKADILAVNPHRGHFEHLDGVIYVAPEAQRIIGFKDVRADEFWVAEHIPGRPMLPGSIMIEAAAQLAAFYLARYCGWGGFVGFGGVNDVRFGRPVVPGERLVLLLQQTRTRHGRSTGNVQGLVGDEIVFYSEVIGVQL